MKLAAVTVITSTLLIGCATGPRTEFSRPALGAVEDGLDCVTEEVTEEGWTIASVDDAGLLRAESGTDWLQATLIPAEGGLTAARHQIQIEINDDDSSRQVAEEVIVACST